MNGYAIPYQSGLRGRQLSQKMVMQSPFILEHGTATTIIGDYITYAQ